LYGIGIDWSSECEIKIDLSNFEELALPLFRLMGIAIDFKTEISPYFLDVV
jgi:hypothetical protein